MYKNPYQVTKDFEAALCEYTGAKYAVAVNSGTAAILLAVRWCFDAIYCTMKDNWPWPLGSTLEIPKRTYVSDRKSVV